MLAFGGISPHAVQRHADEMNASLRVPEVFAARVRTLAYTRLLNRGACVRQKWGTAPGLFLFPCSLNNHSLLPTFPLFLVGHAHQ